MGGSVGANLAYMASGAGWGVKTAVALSGNAKNANLLATNVEDFKPRNTLLVAASGDGGREAYARQMFEQAGEPKKLEILGGSEAHGASMLQQILDGAAIHELHHVKQVAVIVAPSVVANDVRVNQSLEHVSLF